MRYIHYTVKQLLAGCTLGALLVASGMVHAASAAEPGATIIQTAAVTNAAPIAVGQGVIRVAWDRVGIMA